MERPILLTTWSFGLRAGRTAWAALEAGRGALDAVELACIAAESDPEIDSVGYGGLPDRDGGVSLDGCVMLSPRRCGSACFVRSTRHPVSVARRVMERTGHIMLAGEGADAFAREQGLAATGEEAELLAPAARAAWLRWRAAPVPVDQSVDSSLRPPGPPRPIDRGPEGGGRLFGPATPESPGVGDLRSGDSSPRSPESRWRHHDTIGVLAIDATGALAGACSTSGTPFKRFGRVGDSPIIGHGLYVDPLAGAATATGAGELIMGTCGSFLVVESLRRGATPAEAVEEALRRIASGGALEPHHQVAFIALRPDGTWAAGALRDGYQTTVWSRRRSLALPPEVLLEDSRS
ncbi:MAG: isoaspartyl peptidase/L-asparaginase [Phycisphaerales bacterium]